MPAPTLAELAMQLAAQTSVLLSEVQGTAGAPERPRMVQPTDSMDSLTCDVSVARRRSVSLVIDRRVEDEDADARARHHPPHCAEAARG